MKDYNWKYKEQETYDAIVEYIRQYGYSPTVRELCEMTDVKSTSTMQARLEKLRQKGDIDIMKGAKRTIVVKKITPTIPIRCKECRYHRKTNNGVAIWCMCYKLNMKTDDDFYCAFGEEK